MLVWLSNPQALVFHIITRFTNVWNTSTSAVQRSTHPCTIYSAANAIICVMVANRFFHEASFMFHVFEHNTLYFEIPSPVVVRISWWGGWFLNFDSYDLMTNLQNTVLCRRFIYALYIYRLIRHTGSTKHFFFKFFHDNDTSVKIYDVY